MRASCPDVAGAVAGRKRARGVLAAVVCAGGKHAARGRGAARRHTFVGKVATTSSNTSRISSVRPSLCRALRSTMIESHASTSYTSRLAWTRICRACTSMASTRSWSHGCVTWVCTWSCRAEHACCGLYCTIVAPACLCCHSCEAARRHGASCILNPHAGVLAFSSSPKAFWLASLRPTAPRPRSRSAMLIKGVAAQDRDCWWASLGCPHQHTCVALVMGTLSSN